MTETAPRNAYWMHDVLRVSESITIGGYAWRLVQYRKIGSRGRVEPTRYVDCEWHELGDGLQRWHQACNWPGTLPQGLRALYDACPWAHPPHEERDAAVSPEALRKSIAETAPGLFECSPAPQGTRVRTPLLYSDGGVVDVFVLEPDGEVCVTDFGEALGRLRMQSVEAGRSAEQTRRIEDTCQTLGVTLDRGQLLLRLGADAIIAEAVLRVGQAAVRISDHIAMTRP